ncbi:MAG: ribonuclease H-like domain-containing protein [Haloarculaceae archaeon]
MRVDQSFIGADGVGETIERRLWRAGVTHWDEFAGEAVGPIRADRIREFIEQGRSALADENVAFFSRTLPSTEQWRTYATFREKATFFDIETTGLDHRDSIVTTVSLHRNGDTRTLVRGDDLTAETLRATLGEADLLVTFNGKRFDVPFIEATFDVDCSAPHLDLMHACRRANLKGGLSEIERELGVERDRPDISGRDAVRLWHEHERGVDGALETLVSYNREDTVNMVEVADHLTAALRPPEAPAPPIDPVRD